jgi:hypothetical protein
MTIVSGNHAIKVLAESLNVNPAKLKKVVITLEVNEVARIETTSFAEDKAFEEIVKKYYFAEKK